MNFGDIQHYRGNMVGKDYPSFLASRPELVESGGLFLPVGNRQAVLEANVTEVSKYYRALGSEFGASSRAAISTPITSALEGLGGGLLTGKTDGEADTTGGLNLSGFWPIALIFGGVYLLGKLLGRKG